MDKADSLYAKYSRPLSVFALVLSLSSPLDDPQGHDFSFVSESPSSLQDMSATPANDSHDTPSGMTEPNTPTATPTSPPLLPRPALSSSNSQFRFVAGDAPDAAALPPIEALPPEVASADISIARKWVAPFTHIDPNTIQRMAPSSRHPPAPRRENSSGDTTSTWV